MLIDGRRAMRADIVSNASATWPRAASFAKFGTSNVRSDAGGPGLARNLCNPEVALITNKRADL
jgi:hypothetical protein